LNQGIGLQFHYYEKKIFKISKMGGRERQRELRNFTLARGE
jgi:hypothetical protein